MKIPQEPLTNSIGQTSSATSQPAIPSAGLARLKFVNMRTETNKYLSTLSVSVSLYLLL